MNKALLAITASAMTMFLLNIAVQARDASALADPSPANKKSISAESSAPSAYFSRLKEVMTGEWVGQYTNGTFSKPGEWKPVRVEYRLTSNGTALVEDYLFGDSAVIGMTTVYHQDNDDLRLTHYCGASNHPSMIARELDADAQRVLFDFTSITNLKNAEDYHSRQMEVEIVASDHIKIQYRGLMEGEIRSQAYNLRRTE